VSKASFERIKQAVLAARSLEGASRSAYLDGLGDPELRREVESLLTRDVAPARIIETGALASGLGARLAETLEPLRGPPMPERIGPYSILGVLGEGGMGTVYRAEQSSPRQRVVALKVVRHGLDAELALERFEAEREAVGMLSHPGIARLLDAGTDESGRLYFAMELVEGSPITEYCDGHRLTTHERLALFLLACDAIHYAHRRGIIHRDLKPSNLFAAAQGPTAVLKVIDFGIAKMAQEPIRRDLTRQGHYLGTPEYMSPEQAGGAPDQLGPPSDVYALGVILYELLSGQRPYELSDLAPFDALKAIRETRPERPSTRLGTERARGASDASGAQAAEAASRARGATPEMLRRQLEGDLDSIVLKALRKRPEDRFGSVEELAADIRRHLEGVPVEAGAREASPSKRQRRAKTSAPAAPHNLPQPVSSFVGRAREIAEIVRQIGEGRLVTLTGVGGGGKTRLSLEVARQLLPEFRDGVWWIELAPLGDAEHIATTVIVALGIRSEAKRSAQDTLIAHLKDKRLVLVLDNCEHLIEGSASLVDAILRSAPEVRVLATSREGLRLDGEITFSVPPLALPDSITSSDLAALENVEAVQLFLGRARQARQGFTLSKTNAESILEICRRLDGIPLAIELAAARVRTLPVEEIVRRLDQRFRLLTGGARTALPHHQTLQGLIQWSYDHLTPAEQTLFQRLSMFAGGWDLEGAEAVCAGDGLDAGDALELISGLVEKSLAETDSSEARPEGRIRYRMLETIREYARERLHESGEEARMRHRHRDHYLTLAEAAGTHALDAGEADRFSRLDAERQNLRAALETCFEELADGGPGLRLAHALFRYWLIRGWWEEGRTTLARALDAPGAKRRSVWRANALRSAAEFARRHGDVAECLRMCDEALTIFTEQRDRAGVAAVLAIQARIAFSRGDHEQARRAYEESLGLWREVGNHKEAAEVLSMLGAIAFDCRDPERARVLMDEALTIRRRIGNKAALVESLSNIGIVASELGEFARARDLFEECIAISRQMGNRMSLAITLGNLGILATKEGRFDEARALNRECLAMRRDLGGRSLIASSLEAFAKLAGRQDQQARATRLFGAARVLREAIGSRLSEAEERELEGLRAALRGQLGEERFAREWEAGRAATLEESIAYALSGEGQESEVEGD
jgi:non-specific serine/threonine protein kinase